MHYVEVLWLNEVRRTNPAHPHVYIDREKLECRDLSGDASTTHTVVLTISYAASRFIFDGIAVVGDEWVSVCCT